MENPKALGTYTFRQFFISARMMGAILRYIEQGLPPGPFLTAVIDNDLRAAVSYADDENMANLPAFVAYFVYNEPPSGCWGSSENRRAWLARPEFARMPKAVDGNTG